MVHSPTRVDHKKHCFLLGAPGAIIQVRAKLEARVSLREALGLFWKGGEVLRDAGAAVCMCNLGGGRSSGCLPGIWLGPLCIPLFWEPGKEFLCGSGSQVKANPLNSVLLLISLPPSLALSKHCPLSISKDRLPQLLLSKARRMSGDRTGHHPGQRSFLSFQQNPRALTVFLLLSDISSIWRYWDQSMEHGF